MKQYQLVLATDLDGTFLEGNSATKRFVYNRFAELREQVLLIYTTGRPIETVKQFCLAGYLPLPHYILGDHGTHIADETFTAVKHLQNPISELWNQSNARLRELLRHERGIQLQPIDPPYRVAYYYDPAYLKNETLKRISAAGFDFILSCESYLDILPKRVNKGSSLLKLLDYLNIQHDAVLTSGDSLNDLSLFQTGLKSIVVANSEPKLVAITKELANVYHSPFHGLLGVMDGIKFYGKLQHLNI